MNILFLSMTFPDANNTHRGTYNLDLCAALAERHRVQVISPRSWYEWLNTRWSGSQYKPSPDTVAHGLPVTFPIFWYVPRLNPQNLGNAIWRSVRGTVRNIATNFKPDVVVSYWAFPDADGGLQIARYFDIPSVVIVGGSDVLILPNDPGRGPAVRRVLRQSSKVATVSEGLRQVSISLGVPSERVRTIRQGISARFNHSLDRVTARQQLNLDDKAEILLWVGRMVPVKNLEFLVASVKRLIVSRPSLQLHLIGDGEIRKQLQSHIESEGLSHAIFLQGAVGHEKLPSWYRASDITVLSSHSEGLPNVLRESLASGTPFVSTDVGDIKEIAQPEFSRLVPDGDLAAFTSAIETLLNKRHQFQEKASVLRTWSDCADDFSTLFEELVNANTVTNTKGYSDG